MTNARDFINNELLPLLKARWLNGTDSDVLVRLLERERHKWDKPDHRAKLEKATISRKERVEPITLRCDDLSLIRKLGSKIPCNTGGTFANDPVDAILVNAIEYIEKLEIREKLRQDELTDGSGKGSARAETDSMEAAQPSTNERTSGVPPLSCFSKEQLPPLPEKRDERAISCGYAYEPRYDQAEFNQLIDWAQSVNAALYKRGE